MCTLASSEVPDALRYHLCEHSDDLSEWYFRGFAKAITIEPAKLAADIEFQRAAPSTSQTQSKEQKHKLSIHPAQLASARMPLSL